MVLIYAGLEDYDKAMDAIEFYFNSQMGILFTLTDPQFIPLHKWKRYHQLERQIKLPKNEYTTNSLTIQTDLKQKIHINPKLLLYTKSESNYTKLICYNNFRIEKKIIRISLRDLLKQLPTDNFLGCHRSYIINTTLEYQSEGNARGYILTSEKHGFKVPVSRSKIKTFMEKFDA